MIPAPLPGRLRPITIAIGLLVFTTSGLSIALAALALRSRPQVIAPGVRESQVVVPDQVPEAAVRKFGLLYLYHFDGYTPYDIEERSNWVLKFVAPEHQEEVARSLSERATYVLRAKEASQVVLPLPSRCSVRRAGDGLFRFEAVGLQRIYIAGNLKSETKMRYTIDVRPSVPSDDDPYGFVVVGQAIRPEPGEEGARGAKNP